MLVLTLLSLVAGFLLRTSFRAPAIDEGKLLAETAPGVQYGPKTGEPLAARAADGSAAFNSFDAAPEVRGYAGPIKVLVVLDRGGRVRGLRIIEHRETENYVHYLLTPAYLSRFIGKTVTDAFEVDRDIDGVTRATVSAKALADTVRTSSRRVARIHLGLETGPDARQDGRDLGWLWYLAALSLALAGYGATKQSKRFGRLRDTSLLTGIIVLGIVLATPFSILHLFNLLLGRPSASPLWYVLVGSVLLTTLFAGRLYCGWLCPFGGLAEFIGRLPIRKWDLPPQLDQRARQLKYVLLGCATVLVLASGDTGLGNFEVYVALFARHGSIVAWALVVLALLANLRVPRFWCRFLCPIGALAGLLARRAPGYPSSPDCPMANRPDQVPSECIRCNRCFTSSQKAETS